MYSHYETVIDSRDFVGFYEADEENGYLSNWYLSRFSVDGVTFCSMEQYFMYSKAMLFDDSAIAARILATTDQSVIKHLGRESTFESKSWNGLCQLIIYRGLMAKFEQNPALAQQLLETGNKLLVECSPTDNTWGCGIGVKDPRRFDKRQWTGRNLMGFTLMQVREELRHQ